MSAEVVASALVATLERAWGAIVTRCPEVPPVVVVVAPGSGGRGGELKLGHFAAGRWEVQGGQRAELLVGGEGLAMGAEEVLGTLLHEAAHGLGWTRRIQNTSRGGRYHNRKYKALAEELGLDVGQAGTLGWSATSMRAATAAGYASVLAELEPALILWRRAESSGGGTTSGGRNLVACQCPCLRRIRVSQTTLAQGPIECGMCHGLFSPPPSPGEVEAEDDVDGSDGSAT